MLFFPYFRLHVFKKNADRENELAKGHCLLGRCKIERQTKLRMANGDAFLLHVSPSAESIFIQISRAIRRSLIFEIKSNFLLVNGGAEREMGPRRIGVVRSGKRRRSDEKNGKEEK